MTDTAAIFASAAVALYAGHHIGDYWVQTDHQARHKGDAGTEGRAQCLLHVLSYTLTQTVLLVITFVALGIRVNGLLIPLAMLVSGGTHYLADRREFGLMVKLARRLPGKAAFLTLGVPRQGRTVTAHGAGWKTEEVPLDTPSLGTGSWALDQSWHILLGVWLPALVLAALS